jgi:hypothetical protein
MVLVRAGWYHFMVMTLDGRINCFIGSGLEGSKDENSYLGTPDTRGWGFWDNDWARVDSSLIFSDNSRYSRSSVVLSGSASGGLVNESTYYTEEDVAIHVPANSVRFPPGGVGWNCSERDKYPIVDSLFPLNEGVCRNGGCWYERNRIKAFDNEPTNGIFGTKHLEYFWPHGYLEFDGSGCTAGRSSKINGVTSDRWKYLITKKYGTFGDFTSVNFNNYAGITMVEEYRPPVIPAPAGHPLRPPTIPTTGAGDAERSLKVVDIECGAYHNVIRLEDNTIMCWGLNSMGQCNVPDSLKAGITLGRHPKIDKIFSIHAGFSTTAVLFNDGTALCWGDPEVACHVNAWTDIRVSPIKRHNGNPNNPSCSGAGSPGFPDPDKPQYPANKYDKPTYNANTDWFKYWRTGTPGYPHFDLGVEVDPIYPVNWNALYQQYLVDPIDGDCNLFEPKSWCAECEDQNTGMSIGKDFAVGMRRTGQIITSKKGPYTNPENSNLYSRDCSFDNFGSGGVYQAVGGFVKPGDRGVNYADVLFCSNCPDSGPDTNGNCPSYCGGNEQGSCREWMSQQGYIKKCDPLTYPCAAYDHWEMSDTYSLPCSYGRLKPYGIGCMSSSYMELGYDPNWAVTSNKYQAGQQVRPASTPGGRYPSWNTINASYGWSTKVAAPGRSKPSTRGNGAILPWCQADRFEAGYCEMDLGQDAPCDLFCPSNPGFRWSGAMGAVAGRAGKGVPGYFHYPLHMATALMCIAGTNTVAWTNSSQLLGRDLVTLNNVLIEEDTSTRYSEFVKTNCENYHFMGNNPTDCSECAYVGGNVDQHFQEIGNTTYGCIFGRPCGVATDPSCYNANADKNGANNPFSTDPYSDNDCLGRSIIQPQWGFPTRPWGPWNLMTSVGFGDPKNNINAPICHRKISQSDSHVGYRTGGEGPSSLGPDLMELPWRAALGPGMPTWFTRSCRRIQLQFYYGGTIYGGIPPTQNSIIFSTPSFICPDEILPPGERAINVDCYLNKNINNCGCGWKGISYLWTCDKFYWECMDKTAWQVFPKQDFELNYPGRGAGDGAYEPALDATTFETFLRNRPYYRPSGQQGFTCDGGIEDGVTRWCWNNPIINYATGRSFAVHIRACPWTRGLSGEFVWKDSCQNNKDYFDKLTNIEFKDTTSKQTKSLKLWVSGILEDPCPPWPVSVNLDGITCGVYPSWVPVPTTNTTRRADKGVWNYTSTTWPTCAATWGYTSGCQTSWPSGVTGCTGTDNCASINF